jgi:hypothetical protein
MIVAGADSMATEEAAYTVARKEGGFELRDYSPHILAETVVEGGLKEAGNKAFTRLFQYISGNNRSRVEVPMTAPVSQRPKGEKIKMTAPVGQQGVAGSWVVSFMMPASYTLENVPEPLDPGVSVRQVPARRVAAVRYSGFWNQKGYLQHKAELEAWIDSIGLGIVGEPIWARYDPPFMPWFLRRNEVLIPVASSAGNEEARQAHGGTVQ